MGRFIGGRFWKYSKLATDSQDDASGVYTISRSVLYEQDGGWIAPQGIHIQLVIQCRWRWWYRWWMESWILTAGSGGYTPARINVPGGIWWWRRGFNCGVGAGGASNGGTSRQHMVAVVL